MGWFFLKPQKLDEVTILIDLKDLILKFNLSEKSIHAMVVTKNYF